MFAGRRARSLRVFVAAFTLFVITPGATEALEDLVHYAAYGDSLHDAGHESAHHCCSGAFHVCGCHTHQIATPPSPHVLGAPERFEGWARSVWPEPSRSGGPSDDHARELRRPPAA